jgi:hypothetical protein
MAANELGRARISMMVRSMSSNTRPDTLVQDPTLQPHRFVLQRTAGPYIRVILEAFSPGAKSAHALQLLHSGVVVPTHLTWYVPNCRIYAVALTEDCASGTVEIVNQPSGQ